MRCDCSVHASGCHQLTGQCVCVDGWRGERCDSNCAPDRWGANCAQTCTCENSGTCHATQGTCECAPGFMGDRCQTACPAGSFGPMCSGVCSDRCQNGANCDAATGECICAPGFTGLLCSDRCAHGYYGDRCSQSCSCQNGTCNHVDGTCTCLPGWTGADCAETCPAGRWGQDCGRTCDHCMNGATCRPWNGNCVCTAGWAGPRCSEACPAGYYGENCNSACNCVHGSCNHIWGNCTCDAGWSGNICNFDKNECQNSGDNECSANADCHNAPGSYHCTCRTGYTGDGRECQPESVGPVILRPLPILNRETADTILFRCRYSYNRPDGSGVFVTWLKGDVILFLGQLKRIHDERITVDYGEGQSDLTIRQTKLSDSGAYTCLINSVPPTNSTGILNVQCPLGYYGSECRICPCRRGREMCDPYNGCLPCADEQTCENVLMKFEGSLRIISESWKPELADKTSTEHQKLAATVQFGLDEIYRKSPLSGDYLHAKVKQFSEGSVVSDFTLYFRPGSDIGPDDVGEQMNGKVSIGGLKVDPTASGIEGDTAKRRPGDGKRPRDDDDDGPGKGAVAGAVIGVVIVLLLVGLAFVAYRYFRLRKRAAEPTVSYDRGTTSIGADNPVFDSIPGAMAAPAMAPGVQVHKGDHLMYMQNPLYDQVNGMVAPEKEQLPPGAEAPPPYEENPGELQLTEEELRIKQKAAEAGYPE
ncbi:PREDICTED: multiple epidermal growth factor-like domains protein 11 [Branchiostoma belcheri]|uniref:Multiple epidermal growth factor-like domains protein 11 n=1 Tax=Branchiostoma belcheri TaxID=7741 RepID=A0A6P4YLP0_BRABE|nr:PREDICTED: multiple epidermal growth factor-like domains protein 11 [Branchiostoma belcheri]